MHSFHYRGGRLRCEGVDLEQVADVHGTPLYVYSAGTIVDHYRRLNSALAELDHLICYAVKANSNGAILRLLRDEGAGFDIVSGGELFRVLRAGGKARSAPSRAWGNRVKRSSTRSRKESSASTSKAKPSSNTSTASPPRRTRGQPSRSA
jgi:diaminopimelate decarboxylase